jgi:hypothetical protein
MNYRVKTFKILFRQIPNVLANFGNVLRRDAEFTARKEIGIHANNVMSCSTQKAPRNRADIAFMTSEKYSHAAPVPNQVLRQ